MGFDSPAMSSPNISKSCSSPKLSPGVRRPPNTARREYKASKHPRNTGHKAANSPAISNPAFNPLVIRSNQATNSRGTSSLDTNSLVMSTLAGRRMVSNH